MNDNQSVENVTRNSLVHHDHDRLVQKIVPPIRLYAATQINSNRNLHDDDPQCSKSIDDAEKRVSNETSDISSNTMQEIAMHNETRENHDVNRNSKSTHPHHSKILEINEKIPDGNFIVDICHYMNELHRIFNNHKPGAGCTFDEWKCINSRSYGMKLKLIFQCTRCNHTNSLMTQMEGSKLRDLNNAAVTGCTAAGIGFYTFQEVFANVNVRSMSYPTYRKAERNMIPVFVEFSEENMKAAAAEEARLAIALGEVVDGIPYIGVIVDGNWMTRSYGMNYNSLSGAAVIVGRRTGKVLYHNVRNKYCFVCDRAGRSGQEPKKHTCYKNYDRSASSSKMEADIIAEGFSRSIQMYGLIYRTFIGDNDSNVNKAILDLKAYDAYGVVVQKIECSLHLLRRTCINLRALASSSHTEAERAKDYVSMRNLLKNNVKPMRDEVAILAARRRATEEPLHVQADKLKKDISNLPYHIFGDHSQCENCSTDLVAEVTKNYVPLMRKLGIHQKIEFCLKDLKRHSDSLILNVTSNLAESVNANICKTVAGKRPFFCAGGSNNGRVAMAVSQFNTHQCSTKLHEFCGETAPSIIEKMEEAREAKVAYNRLYRALNGRSEKHRAPAKNDPFYGKKAQKADLSDKDYEDEYETLFKLFNNNRDNRKQIEEDTRKQAKSELWILLRQQMLTASHFGDVCCMKATTLCDNIVENIVRTKVRGNAVDWGNDHEEQARAQLAEAIGKVITPCGFFIDEKLPFLGASPDGLVGDDACVEIKCPYGARDMTVEQALSKLPNWKTVFNKTTGEMNPRHKCYYQVQGQLHITKRKFCYFAIWTPKSMRYVIVERDDEFWKDKMLMKLARFFHHCLVPEVIDSRLQRSMPVRNPAYILEAIKHRDQLLKRKSNADDEADGNVTDEAEPTDSQTVDIVSHDKKLPDRRSNEKPKDLSRKSETDASMAVKKSKKNSVWVTGRQDVYDILPGESPEDLPRRLSLRFQLLNWEMEPLLFEVRNNVLPNESWINTEPIEVVLKTISRTTQFVSHSFWYQKYYKDVKPLNSETSIQIIGGDCCSHWRCLFYKGKKLYMYDSIYKYPLSPPEQRYISLRFPLVNLNEISYERVTQQPDGRSCGAYATAFATALALNMDPTKINFTLNTQEMRNHLFKIVETEQLSPFPCR